MTPWTVAHQAPLSMGFPRQENRNELPFPPPGDIPDPGIQLASLVSPALVGPFFTTEPPGLHFFFKLVSLLNGEARLLFNCPNTINGPVGRFKNSFSVIFTCFTLKNGHPGAVVPTDRGASSVASQGG